MDVFPASRTPEIAALFLGFWSGRIDAEIPDVGAYFFAGHFDEGVFSRFQALIDGVAKNAAGRGPCLKVEVIGVVGLFARNLNADVFNNPATALDLNAEKPETRLAVIGRAHEELRLHGDEPQRRMCVGNFHAHFARDERHAAEDSPDLAAF